MTASIGLCLDWAVGNWQTPLPAILDLVKESGFDFMGIGEDFDFFKWHTDDGARALATLVGQRNLKVASLHSPVDTMLGQVWDLSGSLDVRRRAVQYCELGMRALNRLGCDVLVVHPAGVRIPETEFTGRLATARESLRLLLKLGGDYGVRIALENLFGTKKKLFWTLVEEFAGTELYYCFDSGHALVEGDDIVAKWRRLAPRVIALHLNDNGGQQDEHMTPFSGRVPWEELMPAIKESGYKGIIQFECQPRATDDLREWLSSASKACRRAADLARVCGND